MPCWREAVKVIEVHEACGEFPHEGWVVQPFACCATDRALGVWAMGDRCRPILRRLEARATRVRDHASDVEWGRGRLIVSTLRFKGLPGDQSPGLRRSAARRLPAQLLGAVPR